MECTGSFFAASQPVKGEINDWAVSRVLTAGYPQAETLLLHGLFPVTETLAPHLFDVTL